MFLVKYVQALDDWESECQKTHQPVVRYMETGNRSDGHVSQQLYHDTVQVVTYCLQQSEAFVNFAKC